MGTACHVRGGEQLLNSLEWRLKVKEGETTPDKKYDLNRVACLGCCALAPVVRINDTIYSQMSVLKLKGVMDEYDQAE
jgi:NADH-quinone oxidoreductase subunit E